MSQPLDLATELPKAIARLRELADADGLAPSIRDYDALRGNGVASISFFQSCNIPYSELIRRAGLTQRRSGLHHKAKSADAPPPRGVPPEVEAEICAAFTRGDHIAQCRNEWPMFAIPTRVETVMIPRDDATALKITRYYASLR